MDTEWEDEYICTNCGERQILKSTQPILCTMCNSRVFRKIRTTALIQYLAR